MKCSNGDEKRTVGMEGGWDNHQDDGKMGKKAKHEHGRPPKVQGKLGCTKMVS